MASKKQLRYLENREKKAHGTPYDKFLERWQEIEDMERIVCSECQFESNDFRQSHAPGCIVTWSCPECGSPLKNGSGGGEECTNCDYWFCY